MSNSTNPLAKYFRQPVLYVKLPSRGQWYPENAINMPVSGEVPIYAMTARDEITLKTPDALLNGSSTVQVIESCCPAITDAWEVPAVDLDTILIAIRIATYGPSMDFTCVCPHCDSTNEHGLDLQYMLQRNGLSDWSKPAILDDMQIELKPQNYKDFNNSSKNNFEEQRLLQMLQTDDVTNEQKLEEFNKLFNQLIESGIEQISKSVARIITAEGIAVDNHEHIREFLANCDKRVWEVIKNHLDEVRRQNTFNELKLTCTNKECTKEFTTPFVFEQSSFFV